MPPLPCSEIVQDPQLISYRSVSGYPLVRQDKSFNPVDDVSKQY
jgi:hypothetical protein